jgi:hypothetical protein
VVTAAGAQLAALDPSHQQRIEQDGYVYASDGHPVLAVLRGSESRVIVPFGQISPSMVQAIVAAEDKRFYEHRGLDLPRTLHFPAASGPRRTSASYVKQQLIDRFGTACVVGGGMRVRTTIDLGLQHLARAAISRWLPDPHGPAGRTRCDRSEDGRGARDVRRQQFPPERVQPGGAGRAPARVVVQAVRARDGAPGGDLAGDDIRLASVSINVGGRYWDVHNYEGEYLARSRSRPRPRLPTTPSSRN